MATNKTKIINNAQKHLQKGNFDKAIRELQKLVEDDPHDVRTLLKIGDIYSKKGDKAAATEVYSQVAEFYGEQGFFLKAVAVYKQILKYDSKNLEVTLKLAELYEHLGLLQEAMAQYQGVANIYEESAQHGDVRTILRKMIDLDPENVATRVRLAEAYSSEQMAPEAIEQFDQAATILRSQNRQGDFIKVAERLAYHDPARLDVLKELAGLYLDRSDAKRAIAKLQVAFKARPEDTEILTMLGRAFSTLGQTHKTIFVYRELSRVYEARGDKPRAKATLQQILELTPGDEEAQAAIRALDGAPAHSPPITNVAAPALKPAPRASVPPLDPSQVAAIRQPVRRSMTGEVPIQFRQEEIPLSTAEVSASHPSIAHHGGMPAPTNLPSQLPAPKGSPGLEPPAGENEIDKLLTETDVYIRYGLRDKALDNLKKIITKDANNVPAFAKMKDLYLSVGDNSRAAEVVANLIRAHTLAGDSRATELARLELQSLAPGHPGTLPGSIPPPSPAATFDESIDIDVDEVSVDMLGDATSDLRDSFPVEAEELVESDEGLSIDLTATGEDEPLVAPEPSPPREENLDDAMVGLFRTGEMHIPHDLPPAQALAGDLEEPGPWGKEESALEIGEDDLLEVNDTQSVPAQPMHARAPEPIVADLVPSHIGPSDLPTDLPSDRPSIPIDFEEPVNYTPSSWTVDAPGPESYSAEPFVGDPFAMEPQASSSAELDAFSNVAYGDSDFSDDEVTDDGYAEPIPGTEMPSIPIEHEPPARLSADFLDFAPPEGYSESPTAEVHLHHTADLATALGEMDDEDQSTLEEQAPISIMDDAPALAAEPESSELGLLSSELEGDDMLLGLDDEILLGPQGEADPEIDEELDETEFLIEQELYEEAREMLLELLQTNPFYERAVKMLDTVETRLGLRTSSAPSSPDVGFGGLDEIFANAIVGEGSEGLDPSPSNGAAGPREDADDAEEERSPPSDKKSKITYL